MRGPFVGAAAGHVYDGKIRIDLSGVLGNFPSVHPAPQFDVGPAISGRLVKKVVQL